jgi:peptide deformylase
MAIKIILRLGDSGLWKVCETVKNHGSIETKKIIKDLKDTLENFKEKHGFGRAIAAPQIGVLKRIIYVDFPKAKLSGAMINPKIMKKSKEKIRVWDDCFSFPDLLVKVERAKEIKVEYQTKDGEKRTISAAGDLSELLQHEIDHLDGILAVERAIDGKSFALRSEWEKYLKNC